MTAPSSSPFCLNGDVGGRGYQLHRGVLHTGKEEAHARYRSIEEGKKYGPVLGIAFSYLHGRSAFYPCNCFSDIFLLFLCFISGDDDLSSVIFFLL